MITPWLQTNKQFVPPYAAAHGMGGVTFDPKMRTSSGVSVGTASGTNLIDGTLYLSKVDSPYPFTTISAIATVYSNTFAANGGGNPSMMAIPVYYSLSGVLTLVGTIDVVSVGGLGTGAHTYTSSSSGVSINWTLPKLGLTLYCGLVLNVPYTTGATGGIRVPAGQDSPNDWLTAGTDELLFAVGGTGITTIAGIPSSINISALTTTGTPGGPFLFGVKP